MKKLEIIGKQTIKISKLEDKVVKLENSIDEAISLMVCIGGPLNDNKLEYTKEQLAIFHRIKNCISYT